MNIIDLIIDLHRGNDLQGPGSVAHTGLAIELAGIKRSAGLAIVDIGGGTGASALALGHPPPSFSRSSWLVGSR